MPSSTGLEASEAEVAADIEFREALHFNSDREYVASLRQDPSMLSWAGHPFSPGELSELQTRLALEDDLVLIEDELVRLDRMSDFAGAYISQVRILITKRVASSS